MPRTNADIGLIFNYEGELLHGAAIYDQESLLNDLLNAGGSGSVNSRDNQGRTPLHTAASHGSVKCVKILLQRGADPNANSGIEDDCSTPVHHAAKQGHLACLAALLEYEVNLDLKNSKGKRAYDIATEEGRSECFKCANYIKKVKEQRQKEAETAKCEELYDVIDDGQYECAKSILESIADPYSIVNRYYRGPNTLLYRASFGGHIEIVKLLIEYKADGRPNVDSGITALYAASFAGHLDVVMLLAQVFPKHLIMPVTIDETYPLHAAVMKGRVEIVKFLLTLRKTDMTAEVHRKISHQEFGQRGHSSASRVRRATTTDIEFAVEGVEIYYVDINQRMKTGYTPLHLAVMYGSVEIVKLLLRCTPIVTERVMAGCPPGCLIIDRVANKMTPFHHALLVGKEDIAELLLRSGADINQLFDDGEMSCAPLLYACRHSSNGMVMMLLRNGAVDKGDEAREEALNANKDNIVQILLNNGVFPDEEGQIMCAASEKSYDLKPVIIQWYKRKLSVVKEEWLLNAGISCNTKMKSKLLNDPSLRVKLFTSINLSNNDLESLPIILFQMPSLKALNVSDNKLKFLPGPVCSEDGKEISDNDQSFTLSGNWNCPSLEELDLQHNMIVDVPKHIFTMPSLRTIDLSWNYIKNMPFEMWVSPSLKTLILEHNNIQSLPAFLHGNKDHYKTKHVVKRENHKAKANTMPAKFNSHDNVDGKKVDFTTISQIYSKRPTWGGDSDDSDYDEVDFVKKSGLNKLDVSDNQLTDIPDGLCCLAPNLSKLCLKKNKITEVNSVVMLPERLSSLDLCENGLKVFDLGASKEEDFSMCYALVRRQTQLRMSYPASKRKYCQHRKHKQLPDLTRLVLNNNLLENVPVLAKHEGSVTVLFPGLKTLDVTRNKLLKVSQGIGKLTKLCSLYMGYNSNLDSLPSELGLCSELYELKMESLHLKDPPKNVLEKQTADGRRDIRGLTGYLKSLHDKAQSYPNIKLMVVGIHGIGKSTLLDALRKDGTGTYQQSEFRGHFSERQTEKVSGNKPQGNRSTVGVDVCDWSYSKRQRGSPIIKFSTWDFAGQTEYYATHQCFLSRRALYLVLWKLTDGIKGIKQLESWLLNIQARAPNSTVIIIGTFLDDVERSRRGYVEEMQNEIKKRFMSTKYGGAIVDLIEKGLPNVVDVIEVSCKNSTNIPRLRDLIYDTVMNLKADGKHGSMSLLQKPIPASYIAVEKAITAISENLKNDMPVLEDSEFRKQVFNQLKAQGAKLRNGDEELDQAVQFLHDFGTLLHYDDPSLCNLYFVDPQWLCDLLAHVVTVRSVNPCIKNGVLKISDLQSQIFKGQKRFPSSLVMKYIELMSKFEVAIKISDKFLLIPSLLPDRQKECPVVADHESPELRRAMNIHAYLHNRVHRRQYLMSYIPSGFWARLLTRLIADDRICKIVSSCYAIQGSGHAESEQARVDAETLMRAAPPEWACWKTGIELSCFGAKLLRVCQLEQGKPFYGYKGPKKGVFVKNQTSDSQKTAVEILAPSLTLSIEKFIQYRPPAKDGEEGENLVGFRVVGVCEYSSQAATQLLNITVEHIDNLFSEWYPKIDQYTDIHGHKGICRVSFCDKCLRSVIEKDNAKTNNNASKQKGDLEEGLRGHVVLETEGERNVYTPDETTHRSLNESIDQSFDDGAAKDGNDNEADDDDVFENISEEEYFHEEQYQLLEELRIQAKGCIVAFELEEGSKLLRENKPLLCPFHYKVQFKDIFPDLCYLDLDGNLLVTPDRIKIGKFLAAGAYGDVFKSDILVGEDWVPAAMKIPFNSEKAKNKQAMATMFSYDTYKSVRQELAILVPVNHSNIISFLGVSSSPFAMLLELAPGGALDRCYIEYRNVGKKLNVYVIQKSLQQISEALKYLHRHHIIYRDLKCENVLVWSFPQPAVTEPEHYKVWLKLTDYGISRSVSLGGIKGYQGTPGFMAPEIIRYIGKESYTVKVDCFSFGSLIFELIALKQPYSDVANNKASLALQYMLDGKRPRLTYKERRFPVLMISLMYRCWAQNPDDRPSMAEINGLTSLQEFPKLLDILGLGEEFNLQCVATTNQGQCKQNVVDSRVMIGSHLWFCGYSGFGDSISARKEGVITVFSYHDSRYSHVTNIKLTDRVLMVCSVGSTIWLGTESGNILVFCSLTYKPLALGRLLCHRHILRMLHSPVCHCVLITRSDGCVYSYQDSVSSYTKLVPQHEVPNFFQTATQGQVIRELFPSKEYTGNTKIHCFAAVASHATRRYSQEVMTYKDAGGAIAVATRETDEEEEDSYVPSQSTEVTYELWCGQEKGCITILDLNSLKKMKMLPVKGSDLTNPALKDLNVNFMETVRTFESFSQDKRTDFIESMSHYIWIVVYPGTQVLRWNIDKRVIEDAFDASKHSPWRDLNSAKLSKKTKSLKAYDAQISSLVVVEHNMYIGTSFGCLIICDAVTMVPRLSLRCYEELIDTIIPLRMITNRNRDENDKKLVLSCGRKCLDFWIRNVDRKKRIVSKEMTILTWSNSPR